MGRDEGTIEELEETVASTMNPKVVLVYRSIAKIMKTHRSGKIPKAFKVIPLLSNWEDILYLTKPENWSAHSMLYATKLFASNMNSKRA